MLLRTSHICSLFLFLLMLIPAYGVERDTVRVMSFNIRYGTAADGVNSWPLRQELLRQTITAFAPDLLGVQECLSGQAEQLRATLPGYRFHGVGRDDGKQAGEMCAIFFKTHRFRLLDSGHFWLSQTPEVVASQSWDSALTRMASWVKLQQIDDGSVMFFFNTHFDHIGEEARLQSGRLLAKQISSIAGESPVVVTGDFNAPADSSRSGPYRELLTGGQLQDSYRLMHTIDTQEGTYHGFRGDSSGERIDWILVSKCWKVVDANIDHLQQSGRYPSDHFPVTALLR
jgi:endonuclease/exonuclease/phosphatase family metal-dependent hydrolase